MHDAVCRFSATVSPVTGVRAASLRKGLSIVRSGGGESLNQQSTVAKATNKTDEVSCLLVTIFTPLHPAAWGSFTHL